MVNSGAGVRLQMNEVASRDGLQMEPIFVPTEDKIALINFLSKLGYSKIEVTSFTSAQAIPALRDAEEVMRRIDRAPGVIYTALIPNSRGAERAIESKVDEFNLVMSVSATHNLSNLRMTQEQSFRQLLEVIRLARQENVSVNVSLSCVFGCPMEGDVALSAVAGWARRFIDQGVQGLTLCDTTGMAFPSQVKEVFSACRKMDEHIQLTAHFHNTRAMGVANALAAAEVGVTQFDASLGGIGGCPYAPGASGNVASEDVVHMFDCMGYETGMNLHGMLEAAGHLESLVGHPLSSQLLNAGPRTVRHQPPADFEAIKERALQRDQAVSKK
jgi:hydroxymethylglutaryl-CoA lyase